jgi:hypothetical protein
MTYATWEDIHLAQPKPIRWVQDWASIVLSLFCFFCSCKIWNWDKPCKFPMNNNLTIFFFHPRTFVIKIVLCAYVLVYYCKAHAFTSCDLLVEDFLFVTIIIKIYITYKMWMLNKTFTTFIKYCTYLQL